MDSTDVLAISGPVIALAQLSKWIVQRGNGHSIPWLGPLSIFFYAAVAEGLWIWSNVGVPPRELYFTIFANWVAITVSAAGIYGFTKKMDTTPPPAPEPVVEGVTFRVTESDGEGDH
jgi:hypothetical protein